MLPVADHEIENYLFHFDHAILFGVHAKKLPPLDIIILCLEYIFRSLPQSHSADIEYIPRFKSKIRHFKNLQKFLFSPTPKLPLQKSGFGAGPGCPKNILRRKQVKPAHCGELRFLSDHSERNS